MADSKLCATPNCDKPVRAMKLCREHYEMTLPRCSVEGCERHAHGKGLCSNHYSRLMRHGDPLGGGPTKQRNRGKTCAGKGCAAPAETKGLCKKHYLRFWKYGSPEVCKNPIGVYGPLCSVEGCGASHHAHGYCANHAYRFVAYGGPLAGGPVRVKRGAPARWLAANARNEGAGCLIWPFSRTSAGYGQLTWKGAQAHAHRVVCEIVHGPPPSERHVAAHSCGRGHEGCVRASHLRWATFKENEADKDAHGTRLLGEKVWIAKLTEDDVREIRRLRGKETQVNIAKRFGISQAVVSKVQLRQAWAWLD